MTDKPSDNGITVRKGKLADLKDDHGYVEATMEERFGMVWELTKQYCALHGIDANQPMRRDITRIIRRGEQKLLDGGEDEATEAYRN
jgi:hypothetical protein